MFLYPFGAGQQLNLDWIIKEIIDLHKQLDPDWEGPTFNSAFPFSNLSELNLDWILQQLKELQGLAPPAPNISSDQVDNESGIAGATVTDALNNIHVFITPEMYGATGDGIADDTVPIQNALTAASSAKLPVLLSKAYYITSTVNIPDNSVIVAFDDPSYTNPVVSIKNDLTTGFNVGTGCTIKNIRFRPKTYVYNDTITCLSLAGNAQKNSDCTIDGCKFIYFNTAINATARNNNVVNCLFSHCRYGVKYVMQTTDTQFRGMTVDSCRFHGIGEDYETIGGVQSEILVNGNCSGIYAALDTAQPSIDMVADLIIRNNTSDQGGTFLSGYAQFIECTNNYIKVFEMPAFQINHANRSNLRTSIFAGNIVVGCSGQDGIGVSHALPNVLALFRNLNYALINTNSFTGYLSNAIHIYNAQFINICDNIFNTSSAPNTTSAIKFTGTNSATICQNVSRSTAYAILLPEDSTATFTGFISDNFNFKTVDFLVDYPAQYTINDPNITPKDPYTITTSGLNTAIKFNDGLLIQYGKVASIAFNNETIVSGSVTFPEPFNGTGYSCFASPSSTGTNEYLFRIGMSPNTASIANWAMASGDSSAITISNRQFNWCAIGRWK